MSYFYSKLVHDVDLCLCQRVDKVWPIQTSFVPTGLFLSSPSGPYRI